MFFDKSWSGLRAYYSTVSVLALIAIVPLVVVAELKGTEHIF